MNKTFIAIGITMIMFISSCTVTSTYYQLCDINTNQDCLIDSTTFLFEDDNCIVMYDFWSDGGNPGFMFYNKSDVPIYFNKEEAYFVINDFAQDYYKNRVYTNSTGLNTEVTVQSTNTKYISGVNAFGLWQTNSGGVSGASSVSNSKGYSVSFQEPILICIPPKTAKKIEEFSIMTVPYRSCDMLRFPKNEEDAFKEYTIDDSPVKFSNIYSYKVGKEADYLPVEHAFYISKIENLSQERMIKLGYKFICGQRSHAYVKTFKYIAPNRFYVKYIKPTYYYKH